MRNLVIILGDQLDQEAAVFDDFDLKQDAIWMAEVAGEAKHVWSHKARIAVFLTAMRHFRAHLEKEGYAVHYRALDDHDHLSLGACLAEDIAELTPERLCVVEPGAWRIEEELRQAASDAGIPLDVLPDRHFLCSKDEFADHAAGRKQLRMEFFYREMRKRYGNHESGLPPRSGLR